MRALGASRTSLVPGGVLAGPWVRNDLWRRARAVPSLDLRFADNKSLTDAVTGASLVTFTRASSGTYTDSAGVIQTAATDVPRFDHNPTTGESLGLLVEEARTNLLLRSEAIATSPWFANANTTLSNNTGEVLNPAGGSTATKVAVSGGFGAFGQGAVLTAAIHTGSIWLRCATGTISAQLIVYLAESPFTNIGTTNVTITTSWQRFNVVTSTATAASYNFQINNIAVGTVYAWGAQLEVGSFPTSYIPTTTAAATRAADLASISGSNLTSWYRQDEGTIFAQTQVAGYSSTSNPDLVSLFGANFVIDRINMFVAGASPNYRAEIKVGNITQLLQNVVSAANIYDSNNFAIAYKENDSVSYGRNTNATDTLVTLPVITSLSFGASGGSAKYIRRVSYWPARLPNSTLQTITQ